MSTRDRLNSYIRELESRLRLGAILRGGAILTSVALAATVLLVFVANLFAFSDGSLTGARVALLLALAFAVGFGLAIPLYGLDRRRAAGKGEEVFPKFQQRLVTFAERDTGAREPFLDLLAADTLDIARDSAPSRVFPDGKLVASLVLGVASLGVLLWMIIAGPGYLGHGAALLWTGSAHGAAPLYNLQVTPGDASVRRNTDEVVTAQITGLQPNNVRLYARSQSTSKWEQLSMQPQAGASGFQFTFAAVPEGIEYYVEAGPLHSRHFNIKVVDVPVVKQIRVTYKYPSWTGMPSTVDEHGGDLRAVEGTDADLELQMDRPLRDGMLVLDNGQQLQLVGGEGNVYKGTVHIDKDGSYHVATLDQGQQVRLSDDFFIESNKANAPEVRITRPTGDYRASPIEEVTVAVKASDEFGINELMVHYSVNGGPEKTVNVLKQKGVKDTDGSTMISLEDFKLVPGDLISLYATAKDARTESRTDMAFVQADPFEREFSQSQQAGGGQGGAGGGGGGQDPEQISQREKEIIAETWKNQGDKTAAKDQLAENAKFLAGVQSKLRDQALSLAGRLQARELTDQNQEFTDFQKDMNDAAESMDPASQKLQQQKWNDAISNEQKALQHLLRAEATFRQIVVAFGSRGGGGGAGGGAGRDLQSLFDLELDTEKNQFETGQTAASQDQRSQDIDDALQKLDQLTKRQQELAAQQHNGTQTEAERWQQEMLRRDAEELQRQMEQLAQKAQQDNQQQQGQQQQGDQSGQQAQGGQQGQQGQGQPGSQQGSQQSGSASAQGGSQGKPSPTGQAGQSGQAQSGQASQADATGAQNSGVQQALDRLRQAQQDMERAASQPQQQGQDAARSAADKLQEATKALGGSQAQQSSQQLDSLARQADRLTGEQRDQADRMRKVFGADGNAPQTETSGQDLQKLADDRQGLADELSRLEKQIQQAQRGLSSSPAQQPAVSKLREALGGIEEGDLQNNLKRSAELLGQGIDPNSDGGEGELSAGLQKLGDQLRQAQEALNASGPQKNPEEALDRLERVRNQMDVALGTPDKNAKGIGGDPGQQGLEGQQGGQGGQGNQGGGANQGGNAGNGGNAVGNGFRGGDAAGPGDRTGPFQRGFDTGNNTPTGGTEKAAIAPTQADIQRAYQQALTELNALRQDVQGQPQPLADLSDLINQMKRLDPSRFPGNPKMVEELHDQVLTTVDKLELQLRRDVDDKEGGQIRSGDSMKVPPGYQESVAEYFRRLSKTQTQKSE